MNRTYAIINYHEDRDIFTNILDKMERLSDNTYYVFYKNTLPDIASRYSDVIFVKIDPAVIKSRSATKNFVSKYLLEKQIKGFVHVIEDSVDFTSDIDKQNSFNTAIESMLTTFKINVWFNTVTDPCNYVFEKYNPRFVVKMDDQKYCSKFKNDIVWTSHSNTAYIIYNMDNITFEEMRFDEKFNIPMFYILEFLARKRNNGNGFMNMYPTIPEEVGVFKKCNSYETNQIAFKSFPQEEAIFKSMNINMQAEMNVDNVMQFIETHIC